eukprot:355247-Chlamydomonas_euryale.AAC.3
MLEVFSAHQSRGHSNRHSNAASPQHARSRHGRHKAATAGQRHKGQKNEGARCRHVDGCACSRGASPQRRPAERANEGSRGEVDRGVRGTGKTRGVEGAPPSNPKGDRWAVACGVLIALDPRLPLCDLNWARKDGRMMNRAGGAEGGGGKLWKLETTCSTPQAGAL